VLVIDFSLIKRVTLNLDTPKAYLVYTGYGIQRHRNVMPALKRFVNLAVLR